MGLRWWLLRSFRGFDDARPFPDFFILLFLLGLWLTELMRGRLLSVILVCRFLLLFDPETLG